MIESELKTLHFVMLSCKLCGIVPSYFSPGKKCEIIQLR